MCLARGFCPDLDSIDGLRAVTKWKGRNGKKGRGLGEGNGNVRK